MVQRRNDNEGDRHSRCKLVRRCARTENPFAYSEYVSPNELLVEERRGAT